MTRTSNRWALVLAAGSGTRLQSLTADATGASVPKQFCSLDGGASLLEEALGRAVAVAGTAQTVVVVAAEHRRYWQNAITDLPPHNVIVQPRNRGTANGILLGVSAIVERAPDALVAILPSDHCVEREDVLAEALERALAAAAADERAGAVAFLGLTPEFADPELGYIVPDLVDEDGSARIVSFVEKPSREVAAKLLRHRALWNSFILVARAAAIVNVIAERHPGEALAFRSLWQRRGWSARLPRDLERLYDKLPEIDFSRGVVEGAAASLYVVPVPACGWSDLGTPQRVAACLERRGGRNVSARASAPPSFTRHFNLAEAYARLMSAAPAARTA